MPQLTRWATFQPKRTDTLRPELRAAVGLRIEFRDAGVGRADEPYPGQRRYIAATHEGDPLSGHWAPEEDLVWE